MATLTDEQIEQKMAQLSQLATQAETIYNELVEAGAIELSDEDLNQVAGGVTWGKLPKKRPMPIV